MAMKIVRKKALPIGLDVGSSRLKAAQLRFSGETLELLAAGAAELPPPDEMSLSDRLSLIADAIRGLLRSSHFRGNACVLSLPARDTFLHHVKVPKLPAAETLRAVRGELQGKLPYPPEEAIIRDIVAGDVPGEGESKREIIVVAARRQTLESYLAMARRAKLNVVGVTIEACALVECFSRLFRRAADAARTILFLDLGAESTQVVLSHGSRLAFAQNLAIAGRQFDEAVAKRLRMSLCAIIWHF